ncbi:DNA-binding transcriptional ArsR family regulator [Crossiella equi]|uniref:DNA-binding transcriptional ArsR family regulator n=1 Tax=Crossiella equi TaxID=130796 RepID=A0ABS5APP2_9PSEU|nr:transcriptional regulator [Crossiella equi]MBP2478553.1 DNA-binding transcriptional ArsR family regulator [Crossiella equi]
MRPSAVSPRFTLVARVVVIGLVVLSVGWARWPGVPAVSEPQVDPLLLDPTRLSIVALLAATEWAEFGWVRDSVGLSDSALSKQVTGLAKAEYVEVRKGYVGKRPRTWLNLAGAGHEALRAHVAALNGIVERSRARGAAHREDAD